MGKAPGTLGALGALTIVVSGPEVLVKGTLR